MISKILNNLTNEIFTVKFVKRTNGELRTMRCMKGVKKYITGNGASYKASDKGLLTVWDIDEMKKLMASGLTKEEAGRKCYRSIPLEMVLEIHANGQIHKINNPKLYTYLARWDTNQVEVKAVSKEAAIAKLKLDFQMSRKPRSLELIVVKEQPYG